MLSDLSFHSIMRINDVLISKAEKILLPQGCTFDKERRDFITRFDTCDVLAVPGSGKTTALQAKLFCIEDNLPLIEGGGILVLSHTNNAVNEIKKNLAAECSLIFKSPNFIGTVQDFIDKFLAIPCYESLFKYKITIIDATAYNQCVSQYVRTHFSSPVQFLSHRNYAIEEVHFIMRENGEIDIEIPTIPYVKKWKNENTVDQKHKQIKSYFIRMKKNILEKGILHFDDCYFLAEYYMQHYPFIIQLLRMRFRYVFIDETQDLKRYQLDILDKIFHCDKCVIQRIGDKNQTIFRNPRKNDPDDWSTRNEVTILNSFRLTNSIARVVNPFTVDKAKDSKGEARFVVIGKRELSMGDIPPYLLIFDNNTVDSLLPCFNDLIQYYNLRNTSEGKKYGFYAIGWNIKEDDNSTKLRLKDIIPICDNYSQLGREVYESCQDFLLYGCRTVSMFECKRVINRIIVYLLRKIGIADSNGRHLTITQIKAILASSIGNRLDLFNLFIHRASVLLYYNNVDDCHDLIFSFMKSDFASWFGYNSQSEEIRKFFEKQTVDKIEVEHDFEYIKIGSAHSVKGQTHCGTLYIETSYAGYESEHLFKIKKKTTKRKPAVMYPNPLFQEEAEYKQNTSKSAMRMMYVGFSRPTHLLCYAVFKENWSEERLLRMQQLGWRVLDLTSFSNPYRSLAAIINARSAMR